MSRAIIIAPDGTASMQPIAPAEPANERVDPRIAAARAHLRPAMVAPGAVTDSGYLAWRDRMDASCPCRSLAVAAIGAAVLAEMRAG